MSSARCREPVLSAARLFVQLSSRQSPSVNSVLDVLAPATARARHFTATGRPPRLLSSTRPTAQTLTSFRSVSNTHCPGHTLRSCASRLPSSFGRSFSTTTERQATQAVFNPQKDDDGNDMVLEITPRAAKRLEQIMIKDGNPDLALRIQVESGGCHGFQYIMSLTTLPAKVSSRSEDQRASSHNMSPEEAANEIAPSTTTSDTPTAPALGEEDTVFAYVSAAAEGDGAKQDAPAQPMAKVVMDKPSLELLKGSKVDYTMELIGSQFKIVDNPFATSSCGCGTSFDIKM